MRSIYTLSLYSLVTFLSKVSAAAYHQEQAQIPLTESFDSAVRDPSVDEYAPNALHWGYTGDTGPLLWTKLNRKEWPLCSGGEIQSPINIDSKMKPSGFRYEWAAPLRACYNMTNTGHTIEMRPTCPSIGKRDIVGILIENDWFNLDNIHFHTPSEHRYLDEYYPVEVQYVMKSPKTGKKTSQL